MRTHESKCLKNPDLRTCATCQHDGRDPYEPDTGAGGVGYCEIGERPEDKKLIFDCPRWARREGEA